MVNIIVELSKYLIIILMTMYTYLCFSIFGYYDPDKKKRMLRRQNVLMFTIHIIAFLVMYLEKQDIKLLAFYLMQVVLFGTTILLYTFIYPKVSRLVVNNMRRNNLAVYHSAANIPADKSGICFTAG